MGRVRGCPSGCRHGVSGLHRGALRRFSRLADQLLAPVIEGAKRATSLSSSNTSSRTSPFPASGHTGSPATVTARLGSSSGRPSCGWVDSRAWMPISPPPKVRMIARSRAGGGSTVVTGCECARGSVTSGRKTTRSSWSDSPSCGLKNGRTERRSPRRTGAVRWAMPDSNRRPLPCEGSALPNCANRPSSRTGLDYLTRFAEPLPTVAADTRGPRPVLRTPRNRVMSYECSGQAPGTKCGCSAVGSAQPCQGWGREFESRHPLECEDRRQVFDGRSRHVGRTTHGGVAERLGTGLQSRLHGFESRRHLAS